MRGGSSIARALFHTLALPLLLTIVLTGLSRDANAQSELPISTTKLLGLDKIISDTSGQGGFGFSMVLNASHVYPDLRFSILAMGLGLGASWKTKAPIYPLEFGLYVAPQMSRAAEGGRTSMSFSTNLHATLYRGFGIGIGLNTWERDAGLTPYGSLTDNIFFTLGFSVFNKTNIRPDGRDRSNDGSAKFQPFRD
jgi:hypothetical protein